MNQSSKLSVQQYAGKLEDKQSSTERTLICMQIYWWKMDSSNKKQNSSSKYETKHLYLALIMYNVS